MTYDDAGWHYDTVGEHGLPLDNAATHIGMFFAWLAHHHMVDPDNGDVAPLLNRSVTPGRFLRERCCGEINSSMLTPPGAAFTEAAYSSYLRAYRYIPTIAAYDVSYAAPDTWEVYDALAPELDEAYRVFKSTR
ncbi:DUF7832 domain-containing protein [Mycolicibacterium porcinum]|uniref:DUF7832 domain-containing protein n=1 Tax=Mycolicibacterium porcinum TaxID=39693 RepID=A0ABV3VFT0_9MYCO